MFAECAASHFTAPKVIPTNFHLFQKPYFPTSFNEMGLSFSGLVSH